jgi:hypothetical protein
MSALIAEMFINVRVIVQLFARRAQDAQYNSDMLVPIYGHASHHVLKPLDLDIKTAAAAAFGF